MTVNHITVSRYPQPPATTHNTADSSSLYPDRPEARRDSSTPPVAERIHALLIPFAIIVLRAIPFTSGFCYFAAAAYALFGKRQATTALVILGIIICFNRELTPQTDYAAEARYLVMLAAAFSVLVVPRRSRASSGLAATYFASLIFFSYIALHSFLLSTFPLISSLKLLSFCICFYTLLRGLSTMPTKDRGLTQAVFIDLLNLIALSSIALIPFPQAYQHKIGDNYRLLQGVLDHSQTLGPICAVGFVATFANLLTTRRLSLPAIFPPSFHFAAAFLSGSRTGLVIVAAGVMAFILWPAAIRMTATARTAIQRVGRVNNLSTVATAIALTIALATAGPAIYRATTNFLFKYGGNTLDDLLATRMGQLQRSLYGLQQTNGMGIGFGLPEYDFDQERILRDPIFDLPVMITTEKGFIGTAVLEELGIAGLVLFLSWLTALSIAAIKGGPFYFSLFTAGLSVNIGEAVLFSPGGIGLFFLSAIMLGITSLEGKDPALPKVSRVQ